MQITTIILSMLSLLMLSAHFLRSNNYGMAIVFLVIIYFLFSKKQWMLNILSVILMLGVYEWIITAYDIYSQRILIGGNTTRMIIIFIVVIIITLFSGIFIQLPIFKSKYKKSSHQTAKAITFFFNDRHNYDSII